MTNSQVTAHESWLVRCSPCAPRFSWSNLHVTHMSSVCHSYVLVCHLYVTRMYSYVIRMSLVCTRMSSVCHSYVLVYHRYVTRMYSYVISMSLVCAHMSLVCTRTSSVCNSYLVLPRTFLRYLPSFFWRNEIYLNHAKSLIIARKSNNKKIWFCYCTTFFIKLYHSFV